MLYYNTCGALKDRAALTFEFSIIQTMILNRCSSTVSQRRL